MVADRYRFPAIRLRRAVFFGLVGLTALAGAALMVRIVGAGGITLLEAIILSLFAPTFAWIAIPFWTAVAGFVVHVARRDPVTLDPVGRPQTPASDGNQPASIAVQGRTALLVPVYLEDPVAVAARVSAMARSLAATGQGHRFDVHILSDTPDGEAARHEEAAWLDLQARHPDVAILYRRRARNLGRKAGNIGEFVRRCVDDYDFMVVLDADSLMTGSTLVRLAAIMEADPELGLLQTVPLPARQRTLFGRLVQFAGCVYAPLLATGQSFWQGDAANYWGHNAIVRLRAFHDHAELPVLPGRPPLGGEVLSHDFVEAALLRRAGWRVVMDPRIGGSWEEVPSNVVDFARRDRRWAQGSLQHLRLLREPGLHPLSRLHFSLGAMGYVSSLLWFFILLAGTVYVLLPGLHGPVLLALPGSGAAPPLSLLAVTAGVLFVPKLLGAALVLVRDRVPFGGAARFVTSVFVETVFSVLIAPLMMLYHARFVLSIAGGRSIEWAPQARDRDFLSWRATRRAASLPTVVGIVWSAATLWVSPAFFLWMSPIFAGLLLAAPLVRSTSSPVWGARARRAGLFLVPTETAPPPEIHAVAVTVEADPPLPDGVVFPAGTRAAAPSPTAGGSMHNAERGLFDLRQGRLFLIAEGVGARAAQTGVQGAVLAAVEGLEPRSLARLRALAPTSMRLALTGHRVAAMGLTPPGENGHRPAHWTLELPAGVTRERIVQLSCGPVSPDAPELATLRPAEPAEAGGLALVRLGRLLPAVVALTVEAPYPAELASALDSSEILQADLAEVLDFVDRAGAEVVRLGEAPVPLPGAEDSRFVLFREGHGLEEHVAILVGPRERWPDPVPVRLHSACLTGDLFGSLRCDCGEQLRASLEHFVASGGGVLLYLAQEGRGIGLLNKFRAYTLQEGGLDTIDADGALGFGPDERNYDVAARILHILGVGRIELLTNNPDKVRAMSEAGFTIVRRCPLHGTLNRHNLPYVRTKVQRAGHWLGDMLSQPLSGD